MNVRTDVGRPEAVGSLRPRSGSWRRRLALGLLAAVVVLATSGAGWQALATARDARRFPPAQLVDVGGYRLHLEVTGTDGAGRPTVLLDAGSGSTLAQWGWVQPALARTTRVVSFDRPGTGFSDPPPRPLDAEAYATDLHRALDAAGVRGPFGGRSQHGGADHAAFAATYPDEVVGAVLVDPRAGRLQDDWPEVGALPDRTPVLFRLAPPAARLGALRLLDPLAANVDELPTGAAGRARAALASPGHWAGTIPDARLGERAADLLRDRGGNLGDVPLVVLSATEPDMSIGDVQDRAHFTALHDRLAATLSARGRHVTVEGADHLSIVTGRRHAEAVTAAVHDVLAVAGR